MFFKVVQAIKTTKALPVQHAPWDFHHRTMAPSPVLGPGKWHCAWLRNTRLRPLAEKYKVEALVRPKKPSKVMVIEYG